MSEGRSSFYTGSRTWLVSAAVSLSGTTSAFVSLFLVDGDFPQIPPALRHLIVFFQMLFFLAALWMSILGGGRLVFSGPSDDVGSWTLRGRSVPKPAWKVALVICYLAPWMAILAVIFLMFALA